MVTDMRLCHFFKFAFCQICVAIFWSQSFQHTPLKILVNFESGIHVFSGVLCRNAWNSAIHLFIIWFTDILANFDIQTQLQDCLYEYDFKDKWYRLELLASIVLHVLHSDCIKILAQPNVNDDFCQEHPDSFVSLSFRGSISHVSQHQN